MAGNWDQVNVDDMEAEIDQETAEAARLAAERKEERTH